MASFTRRNAWNNGGTFANPDLLWYARGVGVMKSRPLADPNSWWFFAAIHGQYVTTNNNAFPGWAFIPELPQAIIGGPPANEVINRYWDQCQHQSWFFLPWHRGYLIALEAQIRDAIKELSGPENWALPYWNYFGNNDGQDESRIPPAFREQNLPDGTPNPLFVQARYGNNLRRPGDVFVVKDTSGTPNTPNGVTTVCQNNTVYTGFDVNNTQPPGFGGPPSGFLHGGGTGGNLERNPHDLVHGDVGGFTFLTLFSLGLEFVDDLDTEELSPALRDAFVQNGVSLAAEARSGRAQPPFEFLWIIDDVVRAFVVTPNELTNMLDIGSLAPGGRQGGLMSDPGTAALDPIFYLHHSNIDRMWAAWNANGNSNETNVFYVNGPAAIGMRQFVMPMPDTDSWTYTPMEVDSLNQLNYAYEEPNGAIAPQPSIELVERLMRLGVEPAAASAAQARGANMGSSGRFELLGANDSALQITGPDTRATVRLDADVQSRVFASLANASEANLPERVYLHLENVRGTEDATKLSVSVNQQHVGIVALFGLRRASSMDERHGGAGLNFIFDITDVMDSLFLAGTPDVDSLDVSITPDIPFADLSPVTVGRVSVYRQGVQ